MVKSGMEAGRVPWVQAQLTAAKTAVKMPALTEKAVTTMWVVPKRDKMAKVLPKASKSCYWLELKVAALGKVRLSKIERKADLTVAKTAVQTEARLAASKDVQKDLKTAGA